MGGPQPTTINKRIAKVKIDGRKARRIKSALKTVKRIEKQANKLKALLASL